MHNHDIVAGEQWIEARRNLLKKEKEFSKLRDELTAARQDMPWEQVTKEYVFDTSGGQKTLAELFDGKSQLITYHFMFDPDWDEGCKSCSFIADHFDPSVMHLKHRDVALVVVSRASLEKLHAFQDRMGWDFLWVSSLNNEFNWDYNVSFTQEQIEKGEMHYNYRVGRAFPVAEAPGISVFFKDDTGQIFHTYSSFARGLETFITAYDLLDIVPKGRDESKLKYGMEWVRHHDRYEDPSFVDPFVKFFED